MQVNIEMIRLPMLSDILGKDKLKLDFQGTNVKGILDELVHRYGTKVEEILYDKEGTFKSWIQIILNGKDWIPTHQYNVTPLHEGDTLSFVIFLAGG